jgi:hypothetical protein
MQEGQLKGTGAGTGLQDLNVGIESLEDLTQALSYQGVIVDNEYFQQFSPQGSGCNPAW